MTKRFRMTIGWLVFAATAVMIFLAPATPALANTITFSTASTSPIGGVFAGAVTEAGFTYSTKSGGLYANTFGNPGNDMEGEDNAGGGVLQIVSATGGDFNFNSLDFSAYSSEPPTTPSFLTLTVTGLLGGSTLGSETYTLSTTKTYAPTYSNWTTEGANVLAGVTLSQLDISLPAGTDGSCYCYWNANIDNVVLTPLSSVPEPGTLALLAAGLLGLGWAMRRRERRAFPLV